MDEPYQEVLWRNWAVEVVEASKAVEADKVNEAAEVLGLENLYWGLQSHPCS